jgi:predicted phosphodiesterase
MLFLHISDIHFKRKEVGEPDDPNRALRNDMIEDVKVTRGKIGRAADGILISGDIAYYGVEEEYVFAYEWLETKLCPAAGCDIQNVFVVPGNHDIDRSKEAGPAQIAARSSLRAIDIHQVDNTLRDWLRDKTSADVIFGPLEHYNRFAAKFICALRPYPTEEEKKAKAATKAAAGASADPTEEPAALPFATRKVQLSDRSWLKLWGFSTVIVSDKYDDKDKMLVDPAAAQIEAEDGVTHLVMCHHPFGWLRNGKPFEDRINAVAKIQLFGHEHTQRMDEGKRFLRVRAGALQPARDEADWKPGYNWLDIDVATNAGKRELVVLAWVRMHETNQFLAVPDPDKKEIWENRYPLPDWSPPRDTNPGKSSAIVTDNTVAPAHDIEAKVDTSRPPATIRSVTVKFFKLKEHEQRRVISELALDRAGDRDLRDYEQVIQAVRRSKTENKLEELDQALDKALSGEK